MTNREKRCEDCACLIKKSGKWCCDEMWGRPCDEVDECPEGIEVEEVEEINEKASKVKIQHGAMSEEEKTERKPKTVKISDEKAELFTKIVKMLQNEGISYEIAKENKLIEVKIGEIAMAIDLKEHRKPKK